MTTIKSKQRRTFSLFLLFLIICCCYHYSSRTVVVVELKVVAFLLQVVPPPPSQSSSSSLRRQSSKQQLLVQLQQRYKTNHVSRFYSSSSSSSSFKRKVSSLLVESNSNINFDKNTNNALAVTPAQTAINNGDDETSPSTSVGVIINVALTRELGKNDKLKQKIKETLVNSSPEETVSLTTNVNVQCIEIPCITFKNGPDLNQLSQTLSSTDFDYICITSPEAATVFYHNTANQIDLSKSKIAAVGKATEDTLKKFGLDVSFVPSKATAQTLVDELPQGTSSAKILYPASKQAKRTLEDGLRNRGFNVTRLNTYDTVPSIWTSEEIKLAKQCHVICFGSPSAVNAWLTNYYKSNDDEGLSTPSPTDIPVACIGETSAQACRDNGWNESNIFYPNKPGLDGWSKCVHEAIEYYNIKQQTNQQE